MNAEFSMFVPFYGNKNSNIRYFAHTGKGKKELKHLSGDTYYFCINRQKQYVKITGSIYHKKYELLGAI